MKMNLMATWKLTAVEYLKNSSEWKSWVSAAAAAGVEGAL